MIYTSKLNKSDELENDFLKRSSNIKVIAIIGSNEDALASHILNEVLINAGYKVKLINYKNILKNNIINLVKQTLYKDVDTIVLEISPDKLKEITSEGFKIDILIHINISIDSDSYNKYLDDKKSIISTIDKNKIAIVNLDDERSINLVAENKDLIVITYGLDSKASITVSSIDLDIVPTLSLCLQRTIRTMNDTSIEPLELPIYSNILNKDNLYIVLAIVGACFYYDIDLDIIVETFKKIN